MSHNLRRAGTAFTHDVYCHTVEEMYGRPEGRLEGVLFPGKDARAA